jgi:pilus assembly protein Flp/PilA
MVVLTGDGTRLERNAFHTGPATGAASIDRSTAMTKLVSFLKNESGATAIEYGLLASLIAVAIITAVTTVGSNASNVFNKVAGNIK